MSPRRRKSRLLLALLLVVLLEGALQLLAPLVQRALARAEGPVAADAPLTILCVGDSHTYGLHLPRAFAYPGLLTGALAGRFDAPPTVSNRGVPGQNTALVAANLPQDLSDLHPDVVLILAGANDTWNTDAEQTGPASWLSRLRLVRLVRVLAAGVTSPGSFELRRDDEGELLVERDGEQRTIRMGAGITREGSELERAVRAGLERALAACADFGARPVLMTYTESQGPFATINAEIRELAAAAGVPLVDHELAFRRHFAEQGYETLTYPDYHPNLAGYRLMVEEIVETLTGAGLLPAARPTPGARTHSAAVGVGGSATGAEAGAEPVAEPETEPETETDAVAEPATEAEAEAESEAETEAEADPEGEPETDTAPAPGARVAPAAELAGPPSLPRVLRVERSRLQLAGPPGWAWQALVAEAAASREQGFDLGSRRVPLRAGPLLELSGEEPAFSGRFGEEPVWVPLSAAFRERATGPLALCILVLREPTGTAAAGVPDLVAAVAGPFPLDP